jgi:hypothetical protein
MTELEPTNMRFKTESMEVYLQDLRKTISVTLTPLAEEQHTYSPSYTHIFNKFKQSSSTVPKPPPKNSPCPRVPQPHHPNPPIPTH